MHDPRADAILAAIEDAGYTVSRSKLIEGTEVSYRLSAWRSGQNPIGYYDGQGPFYHVSDTSRITAACALARAVGLDPDTF